MSRTTFEAAYRNWGELLRIENEEVFEALDAAEREVLDHRPETTEDVAKIIRVLKHNVEAGGRDDKRDVRALEHIETWLGRAAVVS